METNNTTPPPAAPQPEEHNHEHEQASEGKKDNIPTWAGLIIAVALVVAFVFFFYKFQKVSAPSETSPGVTVPASQKTTPPPADNSALPADNTAPAETAAPPADNSAPGTASTVDLDYEVKKMDDSVNSVNEKDFNSAEMDNAQIGL